MEPPTFHGNETPDIVIAGWGSTYGVMREAVDRVSGSTRIAMLHFGDVYPLPLTEKFDYLGVLRHAKVSLCCEHNATGQFARLLRAETGFEFGAHIHRYDGRPFTVEGLVREIDGHAGRV
jgi:2-oxoglutarate ferredoxin oxidoreductase subunit alpha